MVVERGLARCPRCVAVADYVFIETSSDRAARGLRYEVRCRKCGERYCEDSGSDAALPVAVEESRIHWPPDAEPVPPRDWRKEAREKLSVAAERSKEEIDALGKQAHSIYKLTRTWALERRSVQRVDHTGG